MIVKKKPGVTESFEELLASPDGESKVDTVIAGSAPPGGQANTSGHLDPGEYLVAVPDLGRIQPARPRAPARRTSRWACSRH